MTRSGQVERRADRVPWSARSRAGRLARVFRVRLANDARPGLRARTSLLLGLLLLAGMAGCNYNSAELPYPAKVTYRAMVDEIMPMRPDSVDDTKLHVYGKKADLTGKEVEFEMSVVPGLRPNTSTLTVRMEQIKPQSLRYEVWEQQFIAKVKNRLAASAQPMRP